MKTALLHYCIDAKTIITWDSECSMDDGIEVVPIWKWALKEVV